MAFGFESFRKRPYWMLPSDNMDTGSDEEDAQHLLEKSSTKSRPHTLLTSSLTTIMKLVLIGFAIWGTLNIGRRTFNITVVPSNIAMQSRSCSCGGTSVDDAIARGCKFTALGAAWLPDHCMDQELSDEFDRAGPGPNGEWSYWADANGTIPLTMEELSRVPDSATGMFFATYDWHIAHCMYTWRKQYRSMDIGKTVENRAKGIEHIGHCELVISRRLPRNGIHSQAGVELNADRRT